MSCPEIGLHLNQENMIKSENQTRKLLLIKDGDLFHIISTKNVIFPTFLALTL